jgi:hypothetical protein
VDANTGIDENMTEERFKEIKAAEVRADERGRWPDQSVIAGIISASKSIWTSEMTAGDILRRINEGKP